MSDRPASSSPAPSSSAPGQESRLVLNNWLQSLGLRDKLTWERFKEGPDDCPTWSVVYKFDGVVYGRGSGQTLVIAKEEAARAAYERLEREEAQRRSNQPAS